MYEGNQQSNSTAFSSFHPPPPPIVMRQAYIFPGHVSAMATTVTEKGITNKELLCKSDHHSAVCSVTTHWLHVAIIQRSFFLNVAAYVLA